MSRITTGSLLGAAAVALLAGCGSSSSSGASTTDTTNASITTAAPSTTAAAPDLQSELLTVSDLPTGWSVDTSSSSDANAPACLQNVKKGLKAASSAEGDFKMGTTGVPLFEEDLGYLPGQASTEFTTLTNQLNSCGQVTFSSDGQTFTGTLGALSFPALGDKSQAYQLNLTASGVTIGFDIDCVLKSDTVAVLLYADQNTPDLTSVQPLFQAAVGKLS